MLNYLEMNSQYSSPFWLDYTIFYCFLNQIFFLFLYFILEKEEASLFPNWVNLERVFLFRPGTPRERQKPNARVARVTLLAARGRYPLSLLACWNINASAKKKTESSWPLRLARPEYFLHLKTNNRQEENAVTVSFCLCLSLLFGVPCVCRAFTNTFSFAN